MGRVSIRNELIHSKSFAELSTGGIKKYFALEFSSALHSGRLKILSLRTLPFSFFFFFKDSKNGRIIKTLSRSTLERALQHTCVVK